jgi:regulator of cell morphogenesis and NO signaling
MPTSTQSIREIISTQSSAAAVLQRFDIDLCSHADEPLRQACAELQLSVEQVLEKLTDAAAVEGGDVPADLPSYSLTRLIQHIVRTHHQYVRRELPRLAQMARKLACKHGECSPELKKVESLVDTLHSEMLAHLQKEEAILFPYIAQMEDETTGNGSAASACFRTVAWPTSMMVQEHESAEELIREVGVLTNGFQPPEWACPTHIALFGGLKGFQADLSRHVHLENDLLFPRSIEMESALNQRG